jgi:hypothetical protein
MAVTAALIGGAATLGAAALSAGASKSAANSAKEAAQLQTQVARELHDHWKNYYQQCDIAAINEVCAEPVYEPNYALTEGRVRLEVLRNFARARDQSRRTQDIYCIGATCHQCNYLSGIEALTLSDVANFGYRWEEANAVQRNQLRITNRYNQLGMGRNLLNQSGEASRLASDIGLKVGAMAGQAAQNWASLSSYLVSERGQKFVGGIFDLVRKGFGSPSDPAYTNQAPLPAGVGNEGQWSEPPGGQGYAGQNQPAQGGVASDAQGYQVTDTMGNVVEGI